MNRNLNESVFLCVEKLQKGGKWEVERNILCKSMFENRNESNKRLTEFLELWFICLISCFLFYFLS